MDAVFLIFDVEIDPYVVKRRLVVWMQGVEVLDLIEVGYLIAHIKVLS